MKISFLVPTYNDTNIASLVEELRVNAELLIENNTISDFEIVVSDDSSYSIAHLYKIDSSSEKIRVVLQRQNLGIVENFRALYRLATYDLIAIVPGDGEWPPTEICRVIREVKGLNSMTMLLTVRSARFPNYSLSRKIISILYNITASLVFRSLILDLGSVKMFPKRITENPVTHSLLSELELLINARKEGLEINSVEIRNTPRSIGNSSVDLKVLVVDCFKDLIQILRKSTQGRKVWISWK